MSDSNAVEDFEQFVNDHTGKQTYLKDDYDDHPDPYGVKNKQVAVSVAEIQGGTTNGTGKTQPKKQASAKKSSRKASKGKSSTKALDESSKAKAYGRPQSSDDIPGSAQSLDSADNEESAAGPAIAAPTSGKAGDDDPAAKLQTSDSASPVVQTRAAAPSRVKTVLRSKVFAQQQAECTICDWQNKRYYFRHPLFRATIAIGIAFLNFIIYAEDPIAHSRTPANIPVIGNVLSFMFDKYPTTSDDVVVTKVFFMLSFLFLSAAIGRQCVHHRLLRDYCKWGLFRQNKGTWMVMFWTMWCVMWVGSKIYNAFISALDSNNDVYHIDDTFGMDNEEFMKLAASGTWMGDYLTAYMVLDMMLQDKEYPHILPDCRKGYRGSIRVICFWAATLGLCSAVISTIWGDFVSWDTMSNDVDFSTSELQRAWLAGIITLMDVMIVMQDWEFPAFKTSQDVNLPGLFTHQIKLDCCREMFPFFFIHITGKWFNYGIILLVMCLDMNMLKNQVVYIPADFGQYVGPGNHIYTITDPAALRRFMANKTSSEFTFAVRQGEASGDLFMRSRFEDTSAAALGTAIIPLIFGAVLFVLLFKYENPKLKDKPYQSEGVGTVNYEAEESLVAEELELGFEKVQDTGAKQKQQVVAWAVDDEKS